MPFDQATRNRTLLWCDRHCCLCKKACGVNIVVHHIIPESENGTDDIDNAIPLCFECHSIVHNYNISQPLGTKYKPDELKVRRNQIYEEYTRHLIPPVSYGVFQRIKDGPDHEISYNFPKVGFFLSHLGSSLPVKVTVLVEIFKGRQLTKLENHYSGNEFWSLNPRFTIFGNFSIPEEHRNNRKLKLRILISIIDQYEREHLNLPVKYIFNRKKDYWYLEP